MRLDDSLLQKHLGHPLFSLLTETADELGMPCYVIGGYVRDIFLQRASKDIDVVTVGSGIELARAFAAKLGKRAFLSVFSNFGTAQVKYKSHEIEFVGARRESYSHDSRKPIVEDGTLTDDQNRRDFTINALAICLNKECFGELVDPFGGIADLDAGLIRTPLDPDITFSDDPLRMMRAIRFATQLGFRIVDETFDFPQSGAYQNHIGRTHHRRDEQNDDVVPPFRRFSFARKMWIVADYFPRTSCSERGGNGRWSRT